MEKTRKELNEMIWCRGEGRRIPLGGCMRRQEKPKNKCTKTCEYRGQAPTPASVDPPKPRSKERTEKVPSKFGKLRAAFLENKIWSAEDLMKETGFDQQNLRTAVSILKNPKRSKEIITIDYDRGTQSYTLI